jgi:hypothetical protein
MEVEEVSDFTAKFAEEHARPMRQSLLCEACCKIPLKWLLEDITRNFVLFETIKPLINQQNCELCRLISQSIQAKIGSLEKVNGYIALALSPRFLIICGEHGFHQSRIFLRLFANPGKKRALLASDSLL